ncbi:helix-turn-helix domain-containing protein [Cohnella faecalis]|uniref:XRE family transcriptional regulator n=1 Tax=Cohnella faecalis TaxID=2315694 RepID=A0A398D0N3_9BACL|nr:helix-turn-helix transcriptional regulator [Cohnella faecalis]RIE04724.1 XRE family transcriptional regulator [Cohnella faecalis]
MKMGERLRELRLRRNISQEEVARNIGITRSAYSHYEINNRQPIYETLIKLATFFDVSLDYIVGGVPAASETTETKDVLHILRMLQTMDPEQRQASIRLMNDLIHNNRAENGA